MPRLKCRFLVILSVIAISIEISSPRTIAGEFLAGVAVADITPPAGFRMSGYFYERFNEGQKDPLMAKAVVFEQDDRKAALVFCDLIGMTSSVTGEARSRAAVKTGIPVEHIAITATHTHTGPLYAGVLRDYFHERAIAAFGNDAREPIDYSETLVEKLVDVIVLAQSSVVPVTLAAAVGEESRINFNRRFHMRDGSVRFNPGLLNPEIVRAAGPIDPQVSVLRIRTRDNKDIAVLTNFALHLDTLGGTHYSADYPYFLEVALQRELGSDVVSLFGTGTCGDINHLDVRTKDVRSAPAIGAMLAESVIDALRSGTPLETPDLAVLFTTVEVPEQEYTTERRVQAIDKLPKVGAREMPFLEEVETVKILELDGRTGKTLRLEVQAFRLGPDLAIVTLPGEVFVELGLAIKRASPFKNTMVIELANDTPAYIPTRRAFAEGSYETVNSLIQPGGGEKMADAAITLLKQLKEN